MKKILLVDDHDMIREGIKSYFLADNNYEVTGEASNGKEALELYEKNEYDLVLSDINMPEMDGIELIKNIKLTNPEQRILVLTMLNDIVHIKKLIATGINGFVLKNSPKTDIMDAIESIMNDQDYYSKDVYEALIHNISKRKPTQRLTYEKELSTREKEVLELIAKEFSNQEIADKLFIGIRTVETHKRNILEKTGCKNVAGLVMYAVEKGIVS
ncbi:MAG: response regulator transcription factor [Marinoscillum sp.]|uniref:response regulator n=1 Tax=Marinoscillum sp. TaxID=2024838 RepID=UPI0033034AC3